TLHRGDEVSLVLTGDPVDPGQVQPTIDLQSVATRVAQLQPSHGWANVASALEQVRQALLRGPRGMDGVFLGCDRQAGGWESVHDRLAPAWKKMQQELASPLRFFVIPVGGEEADNAALESIRVPGPPLVRDLPADVEIRVRNYGAVPRSELPVT